MKLRRSACWSILLLALAVSIGSAKTPEFETVYNENFLREKSIVGTKPDVQLYDADGNPFQLTSEGKYTVVVFGCLT